MYNPINVYAGRPGAGKTIWARHEIKHLLTDPNNTVFYIGYPREFVQITNENANAPGKVYFAEDTAASEVIGRAIDLANNSHCGFEGKDTEEVQATRKQVYLFFDQCRYMMYPGLRDLLVAASKAGIIVNVFCQYYHQVDKGDKNWLTENCMCFVISKTRAPRLADDKDKMTKYC